MINKLKEFYLKTDKITAYTILLSLLCTLAIPLLLELNKGNLPSKLPLFYSLPWGESYLVETKKFIILPALTATITVANLILSWHLHDSQAVLKRMLNTSSVVFSLLSLITTIKIVQIFI